MKERAFAPTLFCMKATVFALFLLVYFSLNAAQFLGQKGGEFEFCETLKIAYPENMFDSEKPEFAKKAVAQINSLIARQLVVLEEGAKCENAKDFTKGYGKLSAYEIIEKNFSVCADKKLQTATVVFRHKNKNTASFVCFDLARAVAFCAKDVSDECLNAQLEYAKIMKELSAERKKLFNELKQAKAENNAQKVAELKAKLKQEPFPREKTKQIKAQLKTFKNAPLFWLPQNAKP